MEIWKDVINFKGFYQVSNLGNVRSVDRCVHNSVNGAIIKFKSQELKQTKNNKGYLYVSLCRNSKGLKKSTHQLVAESFLSHVSDKYSKVVDHIDSNILNNCLENLRVISHRKNITRSMSNKTGFVGVHKSGRGYKSIIRLKGKRYHLGTFNTPIEASIAYQNSLNNHNSLTNQ
jgi:hypothetical protein